MKELFPRRTVIDALRRLLIVFFVLVGFDFHLLWACACGCGVFEIGTSVMMPGRPGGLAYFEYDELNQNKNWHESSKSPAEENEDKKIKTDYFTAGAQYMFNSKWGAAIDIPYADRDFETLNKEEESVTFHHSALGDIRLRGIFSGFSDDMSSGLTFGVRLPSGDHDAPNFDRDTQIGSGSTDLLLGGYHRAAITSDRRWSWFASAQADLPVLITPDYRPGDEVNALLGGYYGGWRWGRVTVVPIAQAIGSIRWSDTGKDAAHEDSGYKRIVLSPGVEFSGGTWSLYADVGFPVYQYVNGQQLVASRLYKVNLRRSF